MITAVTARTAMSNSAAAPVLRYRTNYSPLFFSQLPPRIIDYASMATRICSAFLAAVLATGMAQAADQKTGAQENVVFTEYSPLSSSEEIARRSFSPLTIAELRKTAEASGKHMREQPLDLGQESFSLYVPASAPPNGYSLLVVISPLDSPLIPPSWHWVL